MREQRTKVRIGGKSVKIGFLLVPPAINLSNSLDLDKPQQNVGPNLDLGCLTRLIVFLKDFFKINFEKQKTITKKGRHNIPSTKRV